ncbi:MAG: 23S rRNA (uracil(1939)-C(5))-methyltransferase RlmD [Chlamydiota bacterium]
MKKNQLITIQKFSKKGLGLGSFVHETLQKEIEVEVAHTVIGDEVEVEVLSKRKKTRKGRLLNVISHSKNRVDPPCEHVGICGGCSWQQMDYTAQVQEKERIIQNVFQNYILQEGVQTFPIIKADPIFAYRNKMEFSFSENRAGTKFLGLMIAQAASYVFNVHHCHLARPWVSKTLNAVRAWWESSSLSAYNHHEDTGHLRTLILREAFHSSEKLVLLTVSGNPQFALKKSNIESFLQCIKDTLPKEKVSVFIRVQQIKKNMPTQFFEMHLSGGPYITETFNLSTGSLSFKISPTSFFQPNTYQAEKLYQKSLDLVDTDESSVVYDLYAGTGTLGMAFSKRAKKVIGIELNAHAVCDAKENLELNNIKNMQMHQGDVGKVLVELISQKDFEKPDLVIVDPPRAGLDLLAVENIKKLKPKQILYISCNPYTQKENIEQLSDMYQCKILQPIDQFPHTFHIENIAVLSLKT